MWRTIPAETGNGTPFFVVYLFWAALYGFQFELSKVGSSIRAANKKYYWTCLLRVRGGLWNLCLSVLYPMKKWRLVIWSKNIWPTDISSNTTFHRHIWYPAIRSADILARCAGRCNSILVGKFRPNRSIKCLSAKCFSVKRLGPEKNGSVEFGFAAQVKKNVLYFVTNSIFPSWVQKITAVAGAVWLDGVKKFTQVFEKCSQSSCQNYQHRNSIWKSKTSTSSHFWNLKCYNKLCFETTHLCENN